MDNYLFLPRALSAALFDGAFAVLVGGLLARMWLGFGDVPLAFALRRVMVAASAVMVVLLPVLLWLATATMVGSSAIAKVDASLMDVLTGTHAGRDLVPAFGLAVLLLIFVLSGVTKSGAGTIFALVAVLAMAAVRAASGHAASDGDFTLAEAVQFLHLSAMATWAGGVMVAGLLVTPGLFRTVRLGEMTRFMQRLSLSSTWALAVVTLSGIYNAYRGLGGTLPPLVHTQWGWVLVAKTTLVCLALGSGAANRLLLRKNTALAAGDAARLVKVLRFEAVVMAGILVVSGLLANSPPAAGD